MKLLLLCSALWIAVQSRVIDDPAFHLNILPEDHSNLTLINGSSNSNDNFLVFSQSNKLLTNGSGIVYNFTLIDRNNSTTENSSPAHVVKRIVEDANDFEVATTSGSMSNDNTTDPKFSEMAQQVANELSSGMLLGNGFFMERLLFEDKPDFALKKRSANVLKGTSLFPKGSKVVNNPFASLPRIVFI